MSTFQIAGYQKTLKNIRDNVRMILKEDSDIDDLIDSKINDVLQMVCWRILPRSLLLPAKIYSMTAQNWNLPLRTMRVASLTVVDEDRREIKQMPPKTFFESALPTDIETRAPYYFTQVGTNVDPSLTTYFTNSQVQRQVVFDSNATGVDIEAVLYAEHPKLTHDDQVLFLAPPYHSLIEDGALLELSEYTGDTNSQFAKRERKFEMRLREAKKRMNDEYAMPVVKGSELQAFLVDRIPEIPRPVSPRYP